MNKENEIVEFYFNNKDFVLKVLVIIAYSLFLLMTFFDVFEGESLLDIINRGGSEVSFPITFLFLTVASIGFYGYTIIRKGNFNRMNYFYAIVNNVLIATYLFFTTFDVDFNYGIVFVFGVLLFIGLGVSIYLFKFADCEVEEDFTLVFRRIVIYVFHFGYFLMLMNFIFFLSSVGFDEILTYNFFGLLRFITSIIYILSVFFFKRDWFRNRLYTSLYVFFPLVWITEVLNNEGGFGSVLLTLVLLTVLSLPIILVNSDILFNGFKSVKESLLMDEREG